MRTRWLHLYECGLGFAVWRPRARRRPPCKASSNGVASAERPGEGRQRIHQRGRTQLRIANAGPATQAIGFVISTAVFLAASGSRVLSPASPHGEPTPTRCSCFKFAAGREWLLVADDPPVGTIICCRARAAQTACEPCSCGPRLLSQHSPSGAEPSPLSALEGDLLGPLAQSQLEDLQPSAITTDTPANARRFPSSDLLHRLTLARFAVHPAPAAALANVRKPGVPGGMLLWRRAENAASLPHASRANNATDDQT